MIRKGVEQIVYYLAWDTAANAPKTGDVANHTLQVIKDGVRTAATNSPSEIDATNAPGLCAIILTATELNGNFVALGGVSSTADVIIIPVYILTDASSKGFSRTVVYQAYDTANNVGKTGDVGNHTLRVITDGASAAPSNAASEISAALVPGLCKVTLTNAEMNGFAVSLGGKSSTADVEIIPLYMATDTEADYPVESNVRLNVDYDSGNLTGTLAVPAASDVRDGIAVDDTVGSAAIPSPNDVRDGIPTDDTVGNYVPAEEGNHALGDSYGSLGTEFTGTKALTPFKLPVEVVLEDSEILIFEGCE